MSEFVRSEIEVVQIVGPGRITLLVGPVTLEHEGERLPAHIGATLSPGDMLLLGQHSEGVIDFGQGRLFSFAASKAVNAIAFWQADMWDRRFGRQVSTSSSAGPIVTDADVSRVISEAERGMALGGGELFASMLRQSRPSKSELEQLLREGEGEVRELLSRDTARKLRVIPWRRVRERQVLVIGSGWTGEKLISVLRETNYIVLPLEVDDEIIQEILDQD